MSETLCVSNGTILSGDDLRIIDGVSLIIENGQIVDIGHPVSGMQTLDMRGKLLCPMFINAHVHLGDTGAKDLGIGLPLEQAVNPPDGLKHRFLQSLDRKRYITTMRHGLKEMMANGIIACADFREQGLDGVLALREAASGLPFRAVILARMGEGQEDSAIESECHELLCQADGIGVRDITSYDAGLLKKLRMQYPKKLFAVHSSEDFQAERLSKSQTGHGQTARNLAWGPDFLVHLVHTPEEDLQEMVNQGVMGVSCPRCNGILGDGFPKLALWQQMGLSFALGTDNVMFNSLDMLREMDYASRMARGFEGDATAIDSLTLLKAATINGARALKLDDDLGSLAAGKEANFIAFDLKGLNLEYTHDVINALVHRATVADIDSVYIRGKRLEKLN